MLRHAAVLRFALAWNAMVAAALPCVAASGEAPVSIAFVGQALIKHDICKSAPNSLAHARQSLAGADVAFTNLEVAIQPAGQNLPTSSKSAVPAPPAVLDCLKSMGFNSTRYIHALYQAMNLAFADRDFYYGDPDFPPEEPIEGLLSKDYAKARAALVKTDGVNDPSIRPGDPYPYQGGKNPYAELLKKRASAALPAFDPERFAAATDPDTGSFYRGTTSVVAVDKDGWLVSITPSGAVPDTSQPGATCFTAATFIWHGLRHVGHFFSLTQSRCS